MCRLCITYLRGKTSVHEYTANIIPTKLPQDPIGSGETVLVHLRDDVSNRTQVVVAVMLARANIMLTYKMLLCLFLLGTVLLVRSQDDQRFINEADIDSIGEITMDDETFLTHIVPTGMLSKKIHKLRKTQLSDVLDEHNDDHKKFIRFVEKGYTMKGLTFNIYDDNLREAAIALFRVMCSTNTETFEKLREWAKQNINDHMFDYAVRLCGLYGPHTYEFKWKTSEPPFLIKPNFYVNGETIMKALKLKNNIESLNYQEAKVNQYYRTNNLVSINTNYSGWNVVLEQCKNKIDYFTEDISLNAYNYGLHLLHPFWMSNDELEEINPRQAEHYYFSHQQLLARYQLETESLRQKNTSINEECHDYFKSYYLVYDNGLPFPIRCNLQGDWNEDKARLKRIDIGIKEFISRGYFIMEDGNVNLTADNYIGLIAKIIRANYDEVQTAKIIRSLYGYGKNGYPKDSYNPAPSLLHQPETSLRDPAYWYLVEYILNYFNEFEQNLEPQDLMQYETDSVIITGANFTKLTTFFDYYQFVIDKVTTESDNDLSYVSFAARQRRLQHLPITFDFSVISKHLQNVTARLFLGPPCNFENCWKHRNKFYQLDVWTTTLNTGKSVIRWTPRMSHMVTSDAVFNKEERSSQTVIDNYNMFKFPENLLLPKGSEKGLNMTVFLMITPQGESSTPPISEVSSYYNDLYYAIDEKPLGFPFHRQAINYNDFANNYKFYNVTIFHKKRPADDSGYFSSHLY